MGGDLAPAPATPGRGLHYVKAIPSNWRLYWGPLTTDDYGGGATLRSKNTKNANAAWPNEAQRPIELSSLRDADWCVGRWV